MDVCYLCGDVLGMIFSQLPQMYSVFVRLCCCMKDLLRNANIDGWDALIAQNCDIKITKYTICWYKNGVLHRGCGPAIIATYRMSWYKNGVLHREDGPADIYREVSSSRRTIYDKYYKNGKLHRADGPAVVQDGQRLEWYIDGELHREDGPAIFRHGVSAEYYNKGVRHNDGDPAVVVKYSNGIAIRWYKHGKLCALGHPDIFFTGNKLLKNPATYASTTTRGLKLREYKVVYGIKPDNFDEMIRVLNEPVFPRGCLVGGGITDMDTVLELTMNPNINPVANLATTPIINPVVNLVANLAAKNKT